MNDAIEWIAVHGPEIVVLYEDVDFKGSFLVVNEAWMIDERGDEIMPARRGCFELDDTYLGDEISSARVFANVSEFEEAFSDLKGIFPESQAVNSPQPPSRSCTKK